MKAIILAAGLGTRLKPFTDDKPKALIDLKGLTMLELAINYLKKYGIQEIIINIHHFADQVVDYLNQKNNFGLNLQLSDERSALLDTGGAIKHASWFLKGNESFIVMAVDVLTDLDLKEMIQYHSDHKPLVTLAVKSRATSRSLVFDQQMQLTGWKNMATDELKGTVMKNSSELGFSGIHIIDPAIFDLITEEGTFSIINLYLRLMHTQKIIGYRHDHSKWLEFGRSEKLQQIIDSEDFKLLTKTL